jgi:CheY-like chemotaxis protein
MTAERAHLGRVRWAGAEYTYDVDAMREAIARLKLEQDLSDVELAERAAMNPATMWAILAGDPQRRRVSLAAVIRFCQTLRLDPNEVIRAPEGVPTPMIAATAEDPRSAVERALVSGLDRLVRGEEPFGVAELVCRRLTAVTARA